MYGSTPSLPKALSASEKSLVLAFFAILIYALFPTRNYYWDGILFSQHIEDTRGVSRFLFHPNHLLYNFIGSYAYQLIGLFYPTRALYVLQGLNIALSGCAIVTLIDILRKLAVTLSGQLILASLFAFGATWWRFATDADPYILSTLLLLISFRLLLSESPRRYLTCSLLTASAMLIHQLALLFLPVAVVAIVVKGREHSRKWIVCQLALYLVPAIGITLGLYAIAYQMLSGSIGSPGLWHWASSHSADSSFSFNITADVLQSLKSYVRLFIGGRPSLLAGHLASWEFVVSSMLAAIVGGLFVKWIRKLREPMIHEATESKAELAKICSLTWLISYALFLFFWLPGNTFYKIFVLPAIIFLLARSPNGLGRSGQRPSTPLFAIFVALLFWINFTFAIYPYSRVGSQLVQFSLSLQRTLPRNAIVLYAEFIPDDWYMRYFSPQASWIQITSIEQASSIYAKAAQRGKNLWIDNTAAQYFRQVHFKILNNADQRALKDNAGNIRLIRIL